MDNQNPNQEPPIVNAPQRAQPITQPQQSPIANTPPNSDTINNKVPTILVVLLLLFAYPIGLLFMFLGTKWPKWAKILALSPIILGVLGIVLSIFIISLDPFHRFNKKSNPTPSSAPITTQTSTPAQSPSPATDITSSWKTLSNSICKFSFKYPTTWQAKLAESNKSCLLTIVDPSRGKNQFFTLSIVSSTTWEYILSKYPGGQKTTVAGLDAYLPKPINDQTGVLNGIYLHQGTTIYNIVYYQSPTDSELNKTYQLIINTLKFQ